MAIKLIQRQFIGSSIYSITVVAEKRSLRQEDDVSLDSICQVNNLLKLPPCDFSIWKFLERQTVSNGIQMKKITLTVENCVTFKIVPLPWR